MKMRIVPIIILSVFWTTYGMAQETLPERYESHVRSGSCVFMSSPGESSVKAAFLLPTSRDKAWAYLKDREKAADYGHDLKVARVMGRGTAEGKAWVDMYEERSILNGRRIDKYSVRYSFDEALHRIDFTLSPIQPADGNVEELEGYIELSEFEGQTLLFYGSQVQPPLPPSLMRVERKNSLEKLRDILAESGDTKP